MVKIRISIPYLTKAEEKAVISVLKSGRLVMGECCKKFEKYFANFCQVKYAISTSSGTSALHLALLALNIKEGDEVITTPFSFIATANAILYTGAKPVFVDIDPFTYNIDPKSIEEKITRQTKAILVVHLYGQPCKMEEILKIAKKYKLFVIEDAAQAHGARYKNKKVGSLGDIGAFSFYATKNITTGEGGMITTNRKKLAKKVEILRNQGQSKQYFIKAIGYNYQMTEIAAAIGIEQLKRIKKLNKKRQKNAQYLTKKIKELKLPVQPPVIISEAEHVFHQYTIQVEKRDKVRRKLEEAGIEAKVYYPLPINAQIPYRKMGYDPRETPNALKASKMVLSLPIHPLLTKKDLDYIIYFLKEATK